MPKREDNRPSFVVPDDAFQPEEFGIRGISDDENGFIVLVVKDGQTLVFDLEAANALANAINHAIVEVTTGLLTRRGRNKGPTVSSA